MTSCAARLSVFVLGVIFFGGALAASKTKEADAVREVQRELVDESDATKEAPKKINTYIINEVRAIISGPTESTIILTLDVRPGLDGSPRTLRDLVLEQCMIADAQKLHLDVADEDVDRMVYQLQKNNGFNEKQMDELIKTLGYNKDEFRGQLKRKQYVDRAIDFRVRGDSRVVVAENDVESYWAQLAQKDESTFTLASAFVKTTKTEEVFKKELKDGTLKEAINWGKPFTFKESELAADRRFIATKKAGEIVLIEPGQDGFDLTKLVSKTEERLLPLRTGDKEQDKKRYSEIEMKLRQERFKTVLEEYERSLLKDAHIEFTYPADREAVYKS